MLRCCLLFVFLATVAGHGAVTHPKPRQAIDGVLAPWNGSVPNPVPFTTPNWCAHESADTKDPRHLIGSNGEACFWFSNGCDIGCDKCDGNTGQKIPCCNTKFLYKGNGTVPSWGGEGIVPDPKWLATFDRNKVRPAFVKYPDRKPTICDPKLRTINTNAECGSKEDFNSTAKGWEVSKGTIPENSMWRKIPLPRTVNEWYMYGASFEPVCEESDECKNSHYKTPEDGVCKCSGDWNDEVEIMDKIHIPATLKAGKYVLGWRWDCEESTQVWGSCSDVTIVSKIIV